MFDDALRSKVNREIGRLNGELCDLKDAEESLRIRKGRLEVELEQAKAMRGMFELLDRLDRQQQPTNAGGATRAGISESADWATIRKASHRTVYIRKSSAPRQDLTVSRRSTT
jgi:hypothetical protein